MAPQMVLFPVDPEVFLNQIKDIIKKEIEEANQKDQADKLLSPAETCKLFFPPISKVTLTKWTKDDRLIEYRIGGRIFYRYSEIMNATKHLKKYKKGIN
jgi:hypothetical protein